MTARDPGATRDYSRANRASGAVAGLAPALRAAVLLAGVMGALLLVVAEFSTLLEVRVGEVVKDSVRGHEQHDFGLLLVGLLALPLAWGAAAGGSRPAMLGVAALGLAAAVVAIAFDLPDVNSTGVIGERFEDASASPKLGFYLETLGAALLLVSGGAQLMLTAPARRRERAADDDR